MYGAFWLCPDCGMITPNLHPASYGDGIIEIIKYLKKNGFEEHIKGYDCFIANAQDKKKWWKFW